MAKATEAMVLVRQLYETQHDAHRRFYTDQLNLIWPSIRCRYDYNLKGLRVWYLAERVKNVPKAIHFAATYIEAVQSDGSARVVKCPEGGEGNIPYATILLTEFDPGRRSRSAWDLIADPLDWL